MIDFIFSLTGGVPLFSTLGGVLFLLFWIFFSIFIFIWSLSFVEDNMPILVVLFIAGFSAALIVTMAHQQQLMTECRTEIVSIENHQIAIETCRTRENVNDEFGEWKPKNSWQ